jgi:uncharacterized protein (TIGR02757 family)
MDIDIKCDDIREFLELKYEKFDRPDFILNDPIQIPHSFSKKEDIEISGFIAATIAWGIRKSIINNAKSFMTLMDNSPHDFILNHSKADLKRFDNSVHRTFNSIDLCFFIESLKNIYENHGGLENVFSEKGSVYDGLLNFHSVFFSISHLQRSRKHVAKVDSGAAAKRLNMFLRWMVRQDKRGVDFGLWKSLNQADLFIPLDLHTGNIARLLGILNRPQNDWKSVLELTNVLRGFDPVDPIKYDFALFGVGVNEDF